MVYAVWQNEDGTYDGGVYQNWSAYFADTFSPQIEEVALISDKAVLTGSYQDKKNYIRSQAVEYSLSSSLIPLSYMELMIIEDYFYKMGKRFGLLREFRENGIC